MANILGISGSLRAASYNSGLLRAAKELTPDGVEFEIASIDGIPLYNADNESANGLPSAVTALKDAIAAADGLLLATPEYNNGIPGVFKNAIDWASRPPADIAKVFRGKPVAIMGASPGGFGTVLAQNDWLPVLKTLGTRPWNGARLLVSRAGDHFNENGDLIDGTTREQLQKFLAGFFSYIQDAR